MHRLELRCGVSAVEPVRERFGAGVPELSHLGDPERLDLLGGAGAGAFGAGVASLVAALLLLVVLVAVVSALLLLRGLGFLGRGLGGDPGGDFHGGELSLEFLQRGYARDDGVVLVRGARGFESLDVLASLGDGIGGGLQLLRRWSVRPVVYHGCITGIGEPTVGSGWRF